MTLTVEVKNDLKRSETTPSEFNDTHRILSAAEMMPHHTLESQEKK
jgi:hypothetical protein